EVDFPPLGLNNLTAKRLRKMLDGTGIKWRVIVVSACYSGSFIDALKDENSLILTAARHDRVSFGCSHENDFTYFGRAYFDQALRGTHSFVDAFEQARVTVTKWETDEELEASLPQIHIGAAIKPKLAEIEAHLRRHAPAN
ncbi:MAG: C13 family peptidase, partial [Pseudomonadota bacterium]